MEKHFLKELNHGEVHITLYMITFEQAAARSFHITITPLKGEGSLIIKSLTLPGAENIIKEIVLDSYYIGFPVED